MTREHDARPLGADPVAWDDFDRLQGRLPALFRDVFAHRTAERTVVVVPGLSLDPEVLVKVRGVRFYEERMLSMLMLLRLPNTRVVFVTSSPIDPSIVDYYLGMLPGIPSRHARQRLTLLCTHDASLRSLTDKILDRPRLLQRLRESIRDPMTTHLSVFNATESEARLACALGIPMYACDPRKLRWGSKSGSREVFRDCGIDLPDGQEDLRDLRDAATALHALRARQPGLARAVLKLEEGFSGDGNARIRCGDWPAAVSVYEIESRLRREIEPEAEDSTVDDYASKYDRCGGIVEAWIDGARTASPSVQLRINPLGAVELISTHDQLLGGRSGQVFLGSRFPADHDYRTDLHQAGLRVGAALAQRGVLGRFSVDFLHTHVAGTPRLFAIEINLRKGGTTLPYQMLQFLTAGSYDASDGVFHTPFGHPRCYVATDNLQSSAYRSLLPDDLIDILVQHRLHFDDTTQSGVVFNLIGAISEVGKLGLVSVAETIELAQAQYERAIRVLDLECGTG
ncbi:MAG: hypothetical protein KDJ14_17075 [Xanthomonadales bacterium]|nr:hypothetical protein [Xanthomonadales bacterium]